MDTGLFERYPDLLTAKDIEQVLGISRTSVYRMINRNELPYVKIGKLYKFPKSELIKYLNQDSLNTGDCYGN